MAIGVGIASVGLGVFQAVKGASDAKKLKQEISDFDSQDLNNPNKNIALSTLKSDQQTEANVRNFATANENLQRGGTRAIASTLPQLSDSNILLQNLTSQDLSVQDSNRSLAIARGEERITDIREKREFNALQGLGQGLQSARQDTMSGINNIFSSSLGLFGGEDGGVFGGGLTAEERLANKQARLDGRENRIAIRNS